MDQDRVVNKLMFNIRKFHVNIRTALNQAYAAGSDQRTKELSAHHNKKVIQYNKKGESIATFHSIKSAAKVIKCSRDVVDDSVSGRTAFTRRGYYFRYAEDERAL